TSALCPIVNQTLIWSARREPSKRMALMAPENLLQPVPENLLQPFRKICCSPFRKTCCSRSGKSAAAVPENLLQPVPENLRLHGERSQRNERNDLGADFGDHGDVDAEATRWMRAGRDELAGNHLDDLTNRRVSGKDAAEFPEPTWSETENTLTAMRTRRKTSRKGHPSTCEFRPCPPIAKFEARVPHHQPAHRPPNFAPAPPTAKFEAACPPINPPIDLQTSLP